MSTALAFDPLSPEFQANPYPFYDMMREHAPILYFEDWNQWFLTGHEDVTALLRDNRLGEDILKGTTREALGWGETPDNLRPLVDMQNDWLLAKDPPDHTRLRTLVHKAFTPRMIERLRERAQVITDDMIDKAQANGGMDLISEFAFLLPVTIIAEMLGVPPSEHLRLKRWSYVLSRTIELIVPPEIYEQGAEVAAEFQAYIREIIAQRRENPQDDLISALIAIQSEGDRLSENEMVSMCTLLLFAGHETTVNLIGNGVLALLRNPEQWEKLKADPTLVKTAVEELLRYDSPIQLTARWVLEDMEYAGYSFKRGQQVLPFLGAANRDPARFANPNALDISRDPNPHVAFGNGIHFCLGAPLARMEGQIAIGTLARRLPSLKLVDENPQYRPGGHVFRGLVKMPVTF